MLVYNVTPLVSFYGNAYICGHSEGVIMFVLSCYTVKVVMRLDSAWGCIIFQEVSLIIGMLLCFFLLISFLFLSVPAASGSDGK